MTIGEQIKQKRVEMKISQFELSRRTGLTITSISSYERGTTKPSYESILKLNRILKTKL